MGRSDSGSLEVLVASLGFSIREQQAKLDLLYKEGWRLVAYTHTGSNATGVLERLAVSEASVANPPPTASVLEPTPPRKPTPGAPVSIKRR